jgi:prolyl-tRNA synthetase
VPGDREVNEYALARALPGKGIRLYTDDDFAANKALPKGYIGPHFEGATVIVADPLVAAPHAWVVGANEIDHHARNVVLGRDFHVDTWADLVTVVPGDPCPRCGSELRIDRGIEVGHVFELGTKYSIPLDCVFTDEEGAQHPMLMGCYGLGVTRALAAVVEEHHDEHGIAWPESVAPFAVEVIALPGDETHAAAAQLASDLAAAGVDVLLDDREARPGVKFADADLVGVPTQLVVGAKGLARGIVERKHRKTGERDELPLDGVVAALSGS